MADNKNPKINSAKDAIMAEMIITEIDKLAEYHKKVLDSNQEVKSLLMEQQKNVNSFGKYIEQYNEFVLKYATLTKTAVSLSESLNEAQKKGIGISEEGRIELYKIISESNKSTTLYLKYLLYAIGLAFFLLLIVAIFI